MRCSKNYNQAVQKLQAAAFLRDDQHCARTVIRGILHPCVYRLFGDGRSSALPHTDRLRYRDGDCVTYVCRRRDTEYSPREGPAGFRIQDDCRGGYEEKE